MSILYPGTRAGRRTRAQWNASRRAVLRQYWLPVTIGSVAVLAVLIASAWVVDRFAHWPLVAGLYLGAGLAAYVAALHWVADMMSGEHNAKYGTQGEEATSEVLHSRRLRAKGWKTVDAVPFAGFDVDHVAIRPGLVIAVESKWTNVPWTIADGRLDAKGDPVGQARANADTIRHLVRGHARVDVAVQPVVVVWGKGSDSLSEDVTCVRGVWIVRGRALSTVDAWLEPFEAARPSADEVEQCITALRAFVAQRDAHIARAEMVTPG